MRVLTALTVAGTLLAGAWPATAQQTKAPPVNTKVAVKAETFAKGLVHPWGMAFLPDGRVLVTERPGRMRLIGKDGRLSPPLKGVPPVFASGQGGLLDVSLSPDFASSGLIYFSYSEPRGQGSNGTAVARAKLTGGEDAARLDDVKVIFRQEPATAGGLHFGSRLAFARDGNLFVTLGERFQRDKAQDLGTHYGKVVRIRPDGSTPPDNPFVNRAGARPEIWSYGHRNLQAAAINPATGKLWTVEHGARGGDEVNVPQAGKNYGWPVITYGRDYSGVKIGEGTAKAGLEQPIYYWDPIIGPSGMTFYTGSLFPQWKGNLFVGGHGTRDLVRLTINGEKITGEERLLKDLQPKPEAVRDVRTGPDGALYVLTDGAAGRLLKLVPKK
jgi:glucose/arabinose dehydrogenase